MSGRAQFFMKPARYGFFICCFTAGDGASNEDFLDWLEESDLDSYEEAYEDLSPKELGFAEPKTAFDIKSRRVFSWSPIWFMVHQKDAVHVKLRWADFL